MELGFYGAVVSRHLLLIGWSERQFARRLGVSQAHVQRVINGNGRYRLSVGESEALEKLSSFIVDNPIPRRKTPDFITNLS